MTMIRIAPAQGRMLRNPDTGERIPAEGALVRRSPYWRRRLQDGDAVVLSDADAATSPEAVAPATPDAKPARARTAKED
jgi:hypothetical protein